MATDADLLARLQIAWQDSPRDETDSETSEDDYEWIFEPKPKKPLPWCPRDQHRRAWRSVFRPHWICAVCHPPVSENVIAEWIGD